MNIGIIGGTGDLGFGLAYRLAKCGIQLTIGSREVQKALAKAAEINALAKNACVTGLSNDDCAAHADLVIFAVPDSARLPLLHQLKSALQAKIVLDVTIPLRFGPLRYEAPPEGSNAQQTQTILGEDVRVAAAFHTVSALMLSDPENTVHGDVLVVGSDTEVKQIIIDLAQKIGFRGFDAGSLLNARVVEGLTPVLIGMNKRYSKKHIGIGINGI